MPGKSLFSGTGCTKGQIHQEKRQTFAYNLWLTLYHYVEKVLEKGDRGTCRKGYQPGKLKMLKIRVSAPSQYNERSPCGRYTLRKAMVTNKPPER